MTNTNLIERALINAGYDCDYTVSNLIDCFMDYVDCGTWANLDLDEVNDMIAEGELTVDQMAHALIKL